MSLSPAAASLRDRLAAVPGTARSTGAVHLPVGVGLRLGAVHEWFGCTGTQRWAWTPPLCLLSDLAKRAVVAAQVGRVAWIGRRCWAWPVMLGPSAKLIGQSCFIDPPDAASAVWAMDVALRSPSPVMVIADGHGLSMPHTRRLQLVASESGSICILARPNADESELSASCTRWRVEPVVSGSSCPRWAVTLLRNKEQGALMNQRPSWVVEWNDAACAVHLSAAVANRAGGSKAAEIRHGSGAA